MEFRQSLESLSHARAATADTRDRIYKLKQKLAIVRRDRDRFSRQHNPANDADKRRLASYDARERELESEIKAASGSFAKDLKSEDARLKDFLTFTDPRSNLSHLDDGIPIFLLPLRLETRFKQVPIPGSAASKSQLWIRVFPDDFAIDSFESVLSEDEVRNAKSYWQSIWRAADIEAEQRGAWRSLVAGHGSGRAYWITKTYIPANATAQPLHKDPDELILVIPTESPLTAGERTPVQKYWEDVWRAAGDPVKQANAYDDLVDALNDAARAEQLVTDYVPFNMIDPPPVSTDYSSATVTVVFVEFPDTDALNLRLQSWSMPPMVHIMPERLVVQGYFQGEMELNTAGELITSPLVVGPDPSAAEGEELDASGEDLKVGDAFKWMVDFDDAVARGMGFKIDLNEAQAQRGFDRLCVLGVRMSADPAKGQELLEQLLAHHQNSRKGLSILRQGTPTNNTENAASGYQWQEDADVSFDYYHAKPAPSQLPPAWARRSDGQWLADCLGINHSAIESIQHFTATDQTDARAMNLALWPATLGYFMESMMAPVFDDASIRQTRAFFTRYVSGRGFIPAIRIGDQPYGILPATPFSRMNWFRASDLGLVHAAGASTAVLNARFLLHLYRILLEIDKTWAMLSNRVSHVGIRGDAQQTLLDIVGLHANSVEVHSRYAQSLEHIHNYYNLIGFPLSRSKTFSPAKYTQSGLQLLQSLGYNADPSDDIPEILTKFFFGGAERLTGRLVDDAPLSETNSLRAQATGERNYIEWLIDAARTSHDALRRQQGFTGDTPPTALLYLLLQHALDLAFIDTSLHLYERHGLMTYSDLLAARVEPRFIHIEGEADKGSRWRHLYAVEPVITGSASVEIGEYIPTQIGTGGETADLEECLDALVHLKKLPTARLERALVEHLDACAYRIDAW
ncbi:MAG: hypothetical protein IT282_13035, partial [Bacteroidetes bacterium]|nr:hypothetical protein [Bacteroidota bacterium]